MNERIKELAKQSSAWDYYEINEGVDGDEKPLKDFADLIIRECISVVNQRYMGDNNREDMEIRRCAEDLKNYFGVE